MHARNQLAKVIDQILEQEQEEVEVESTTVDEYKKLNDKCDIVMSKVKSRKGRKTTQRVGG